MHTFPEPPKRLVTLGTLVASVGLGIALLVTIGPPSTSRMLIWPWIWISDLGWIAALSSGLYALLTERRGLSPGLALGLPLLGITAVISAHVGFLPGISLPAALPVLAACMFPYALISAFNSNERGLWLRRIGLAVAGMILWSLGLWLTTRVLHAHAAGESVWSALHSRNDQPFGHSNYVAAFALLAVGWLGACCVRAKNPAERFAWSIPLGLSLVALFSSGSRASIAALAVAVALFIVRSWKHIRSVSRTTRLLTLVALVTVVVAGVLSNARLRDFVQHGRWSTVSTESNQQRLGMTEAALALGKQKPLLGWGPGSVPFVFPSVRAQASGNVDNVLQVHSSPLQTWATLGALGLIGALLIAGGLVQLGFQRASLEDGPDATRDGLERTSLLAGLAGFCVYSFFDHSLDIPAMAAMGGVYLSALATRTRIVSLTTSRITGGVVILAALSLVPGLFSDLRVRWYHSQALDFAAQGDGEGYEKSLRSAVRASPDSAFPAHLLASWLATGHPLSPDAPKSGGAIPTIALLEASLARNPFLEYADYNLGWLHLGTEPAKAELDFSAAARLAPHRIGVHLGLGLSRLSQGNTAGAISAFAAERINDPRRAFSSILRDPAHPEIALQVNALAIAALKAGAGSGALNNDQVATVLGVWSRPDLRTVPESKPFRRVRPGYGVLMGFPEGRPPADVNAMVTPLLHPEIEAALPKPGWVPGRLLLEVSLLTPESPRP